MTSTWTRCLIRTWIVLLLLVFNTSPASSTCKAPPQDYKTLTEDVGKGTMILKIPVISNENWSIANSTLPGYFTLTKRTSSFYLDAAKVLDYDVLKEKGQNILLKLECAEPGKRPVSNDFRVYLNEANEFIPQFNQSLYNTTIPENARINDVVFQASKFASDKDYDDHLTFEVVPSKNTFDGIASGKFKMADSSQGTIVVKSPLDYETQNEYTIGIIVKDKDGNQTSTKLVIYLTDTDDLGPTFLPRPCAAANPYCIIPVRYNAYIKAADKGTLNVLPNAVKAIDNEVNHHDVVYSFTDEGNPTDVMKYFDIDSKTAEVTKKDGELPKNITSPITLFIKAEERSALKHSSVAILIIDILDRNSTVIISTKSSDSISVSKIEGYSSDVFYGVLIPLAIIVAVLIIFIIIIFIKSRRPLFRNSVEDLDTKTSKPDASSVVIQTTDSLMSRKSVNGIRRPTVETVENGFINHSFVTDSLTENGIEGGGNKTTDQLSTVSTEDNDIHPRSLNGDLNLNTEYCNLTTAGIYPAVEDLSKAGIGGEDEAKDGDINVYSTVDKIRVDSDESEPETSGSHHGSDDEPYTTIADPSSNKLPAIPTADYILDEPQSQDMAWALPTTSGQLESEISEVSLTPDYIENASLRSASLESLTVDVPQSKGLPESTGTTDGNHSNSESTTEKEKKEDNDEDNRLPEWASEALQPTIRPMISRDEFKSHLESLMSSPPQLPSSKTLQTPTSLTPSPSSQSLEDTPREKIPTPPPLPQRLPSPSAEEALPAAIPSAPPLPPPLPPIDMMATHL